MTGRAPWLRRLGAWVAMGTSPAAIMTGGGVGELLRGAALVLAIVVGTIAPVVLAVAMGLLGQTLGKQMAGVIAGPLGPAADARWPAS